MSASERERWDIAADLPLVGPSLMARTAFRDVLAQAQSPALPEAAAIYDAVAETGVCAEVFLAFFRHESRFGTLGIAKEFDTRNPGNVRTPERAESGATIVQTPRGQFAKYPNWLAGAVDWAARMKGPKYAGDGLRTVRQVLPRYAPRTDRNDPGAYARAVLASVASWRGQEETPMSAADRVSIIPLGNPNRPGRKLRSGRPRFITWHETANPKEGANAAMHERFTHDGGGDENVSFHYVVDDHESVQLLPDDEVGVHAGDGDHGTGNSESLAIEICVNRDGDFERAVENAITLTRKLLHQHGLTVAAIKQHNFWSGKDCPHNLRLAGFAAALGKVGMAEGLDKRALVLRAGEDVPFFARGELRREGQVDLREFGGAQDERTALYEKLRLHTLNGQVQAFLLDGPTSYDRLKEAGKVQEF